MRICWFLCLIVKVIWLLVFCKVWVVEFVLGVFLLLIECRIFSGCKFVCVFEGSGFLIMMFLVLSGKCEVVMMVGLILERVMSGSVECCEVVIVLCVGIFGGGVRLMVIIFLCLF